LLTFEILFFVSIAMMAYGYVGYPLLIWILSNALPRPVRKADILPRISVVITAHNEEQGIGAKLANTLSLDYPPEKLEIVVASDCSTDGTEDIVSDFAAKSKSKIILYRQNERLGKTVAQHQGVRRSSGEIIVLSDATTLYDRGALRALARNFADPEVGCVAGQLSYVSRSSDGIGKSCSSYWSYEKIIKRAESDLGSLIGVSGCIYAVRRSCFAQLAPAMIDDFVIASEIHLQGRRTVYESDAIAIEDTNSRSHEEFRMRVRVIEQTFNALHHYRQVMNIRRHGLFAFQMISHKVIRYTIPLLLCVALLSSLSLVRTSPVYVAAFAGQTLFYLAALFGYLAERLNLKLGLFGAPYYFILINLAIVVAFWKFMRGEAHVTWSPFRPGTVSSADAYVAGE